MSRATLDIACFALCAWGAIYNFRSPSKWRRFLGGVYVFACVLTMQLHLLRWMVQR